VAATQVEQPAPLPALRHCLQLPREYSFVPEAIPSRGYPVKYITGRLAPFTFGNYRDNTPLI
jgi:hypothetical protein